MKDIILSIDQGTSSSKVFAFDSQTSLVTCASAEFDSHYPNESWVEQDPKAIWGTVRECLEKVVAELREQDCTIRAIGLTNQRETTIVWDRKTGEAIYPAIVWQDRRTAKYCEQLKSDGHEEWLHKKTGLLLDPYFSASKIAWILDNVEGARARANKGELAFGTVDSYLIWQLTEGAVHATDVTNASRTNLFNIYELDWDDELLSLFDIPKSLLPKVLSCAQSFGETKLVDRRMQIPLTGVAGDQQAALIGQHCFDTGHLKSTYGTGCFAMLNTGESIVHSKNGLLTTLAYQIDGQCHYALEGSIFSAGSAVKWMRDQLKIIDSAAETEALASAACDKEQVYLVPAFTGLGAPHWQADARAMLCGMTLDTDRKQIVRATLDSVVFQSRDLLDVMKTDGICPVDMKIDGGMVVNDYLCQRFADLLNIPVKRPTMTETTALGAAFLAGLGLGLFKNLDELKSLERFDRVFTPKMNETEREHKLRGWHQAVTACKSLHR